MEIPSSMPVFIAVTSGRVHDLKLLDAIIPEPGSFFIMDRAYIDYARLHRIQRALAFFVIRAKENLQYKRRCSRSHDRTSGVRSDQTIVLTGQRFALSTQPSFDASRIIRSTQIEVRLLDQQLSGFTSNHRRSLQASMADRIVLQMDQAAPQNQEVLWQLAQQCEDPSLDRSLSLCAGRDHQEAARNPARYLHNFTGAEPLTFRENAHF